MSYQLKPLYQQTIVVTGATSGIGLATVRMALDQGAKVFMISRNEDELQALQDEFRNKGYNTAFAVADVAEEDQLQVAADHCITSFGGIDTWINNAGISIYARLEDTDEAEAKRLFDTNFWGVVNGSKVALQAMSKTGGALINVGSVLSKVSLPIQGIYSASKHAVKAYTDALRRELIASKTPVSVSLITPGAIDTPYTLHARSHIGEPVLKAPVYQTEVAAKMILKCAQRPIRELGVGMSSFIFPLMDRLAPNLQDKLMAKNFMEESQSLDHPSTFREHGDEGNLFEAPKIEGSTKGNYPGHVMKSSALSELSARKSVVGSLLMAGGAAVIFLKRLRLI